ncbi:hypothetical protein OKA04_20300 [Luteolibacter flavescens]|uniref:DUF5666 domain-containing protein n=1 Tax=Luteolibacter flavescens TaxID=1859460 RepID=A0ABT3FV35_9BACT|nr:hypothetical protein [Luteolibacter flavescens]MCW1887091.1 hypothetical protein [Luteolibacter flavescens]
MNIRASLVVLASLIASGVSLGADGHVLARAGSLPAPGKAVTETMVHDVAGSALTLSVGEQKMEGTYGMKETSTEVTEGISETKARRILTSKTAEHRMIIMGQEQPSPEVADPLQGLPVIFEKKDGKWTATLEEGEPTEEQKTALEGQAKQQESDTDFLVYGDKPRKPGDKWEVDVKKLESFGGATGLTGTFSVEFVEVKEVAGTSCAVLKSTLDISGTAEKEGDAPAMNIKLKGETLVHRSLADLVDLESKLTGTMTVEGSPNEGVKMTMTGPVTMTGTATVGKP